MSYAVLGRLVSNRRAGLLVIPDAHMPSGCFPYVFLPADESLSRNQASESGMNGKNAHAPVPGDVVLYVGNVPAGGEEVRTCLDLLLQSEPWPRRISCSEMEFESIVLQRDL